MGPRRDAGLIPPDPEPHVDLKKLVGKAKDLAAKNEMKIDQAIDKVARTADQKTGGKHREKINDGAAKLKQAVDQLPKDEHRR